MKERKCEQCNVPTQMWVRIHLESGRIETYALCERHMQRLQIASATLGVPIHDRRTS